MASFKNEIAELMRQNRKNDLLEYWDVDQLFPMDGKKSLEQEHFPKTKFRAKTPADKVVPKVVDILIRSNCKNRIGFVNYNESGSPSENGFFPTECGIFSDNIIVFVYAASADVQKGGIWKFVGTANTQIRAVLKAAGMPVRKVVATTQNTTETLEIPLVGGGGRKCLCMEQFFKISLDNQDLDAV